MSLCTPCQFRNCQSSLCRLFLFETKLSLIVSVLGMTLKLQPIKGPWCSLDLGRGEWNDPLTIIIVRSTVTRNGTALYRVPNLGKIVICQYFWVTTFGQSSSKHIVQYHQRDSTALYYWLSAVIFKLGLASFNQRKGSHLWRKFAYSSFHLLPDKRDDHFLV